MPLNPIQVEIDKHSGFCIGVINAIKTAEQWLEKEQTLYCLGDIVHNNEELQRLTQMGLRIITHEEMSRLHNVRVLIRAHGEPPETYRLAEKNRIELIDTTCQVVLQLQQNIKLSFETLADINTQILIFGKKGHAEVVGLIGQIGQKGIVISSLKDIDKIDFDKPAILYSQTTQNIEEYEALISAIQERYDKKEFPQNFKSVNTICKSVINRAKQIQEFAAHYNIIFFVSGEKSSNGLYLYNICKKVNPNTFLISKIEQLQGIIISPTDTIGICGATSTPMWLMESVKNEILIKNQNL